MVNVTNTVKDEELIQLRAENARLVSEVHKFQGEALANAFALRLHRQALEKAKVALEYCGCHMHDEYPHGPFGNHDSCRFCEHVDSALTTINEVLGSK